MKKLLIFILGLALGFPSFAQRLTTTYLRVNEKINFMPKTPLPENHITGWLKQIGDVYLKGNDTSLYLYTGKEYVKLVSSKDIVGLGLVETDPRFTASPFYGLTSSYVTNWNSAYGWGNHAGLYRLIDWRPTWADIISGKPTTLGGYGITDAMSTVHPANVITGTNITNWNSAYSWGNHATEGYITGLTLDEIGDVTITSPIVNHVLKYDGSGWVNSVIPPVAGGTVIHAALSMPTQFSIIGSPITVSDTFEVSWVNQTTNKVLASPNGSTGVPTFRALAAADIPNITTLTGYIPRYNFYQRSIDTVRNTLNGLLLATNGLLTTVTNNSTNWNTAYGWGNHAGLYRPISYVPAWGDITSNIFSVTGPTNNQLLKYNSTSGKWENWTHNFLTNYSPVLWTDTIYIGLQRYITPSLASQVFYFNSKEASSQPFEIIVSTYPGISTNYGNMKFHDRAFSTDFVRFNMNGANFDLRAGYINTTNLSFKSDSAYRMRNQSGSDYTEIITDLHNTSAFNGVTTKAYDATAAKYAEQSILAGDAYSRIANSANYFEVEADSTKVIGDLEVTEEFSVRDTTILGLIEEHAINPADTVDKKVLSGHDVDSIVYKNFKYYRIVGDGETDDATALQAYITAMGANNYIEIPFGTYKVGSTLNLLTGQKINWHNSQINSTITNGTAVIRAGDDLQFNVIENLNIVGDDGVSKYCIGVQFGDADLAASCAYYSRISNVSVSKCHLGFDINAYQMRIENIRTRYCGIGYDGFANNATIITAPWWESDTVEFIFRDTDGLLISNMLYQGSLVWRPSRLDNCRAITFETPYFENSTAQDSSLIIIGETTLCSNVEFRNVNSAINMDTDIDFILFDKSDYCGFGGILHNYAYDIPIGTTSNTTNFKTNNYRVTTSARIIDNNKFMGTFYNYFPNSSFELYFRGYSSVTPYHATIAQETDTTRSGNSALKVIASGSDYNQVIIYFSNDITALAGKKVRFGAWVYVPAVAGYLNSPSRVFHPLIQLTSSDGSNLTASGDGNSYLLSGKWNFYTDTMTVQNDATSLYFKFYANNSGTAAGDTVFIIIDDIVVTDINCPIDRILNTTFPDAPDISATCLIKNIMIKADATPTDVDQTFADGDQVWKVNNVAEASPGWVCTTAGVGGTAVWCPMAVLGAAP